MVATRSLELSINTDYVRDWGMWSAIRELVQNGLDAHDHGHTLTITRSKNKKKTISIRTEGTILDRSSLLLGASTKQDGGSRGKFGEGYKLAFLVLCRLNINVQLRTGQETWTPYLDHSTAFNTQLLKVKIKTTPQHVNSIEIKIHDVPDPVWEEIVASKLIDVPGLPKSSLAKEECKNVGNDKILLAPRHRNKLFSRGLFVQTLPDEFQYGYDFAFVQLDRDRKAPDVWSLRTALAGLLKTGLTSGVLLPEHIYDMLSKDLGEAKLLDGQYLYCGPDVLTKHMANEFFARHGTTAVPVKNVAESLEASHHNLCGIVLTNVLRLMIEAESGTFTERKKSRSLQPETHYTYEDLSDCEKSNLMWAINLIASVEPAFTSHLCHVVDFFDQGAVFGTYSPTGGIRLARLILVDRQNLIATLVHEVAHMITQAVDGSAVHRNGIESIFSRIVDATT